MGVLASVFHFQPRELGDMDMDDLRFWIERAGEMKRSGDNG